MPVSRKTARSLGRIRRAGDRHAAAFGRVLDGVVEQVGEDLPHAGAVHRGFARSGQVGGDGDLLFLGDVLVVQLDDFAGELAEVRRLALELHHAGLGFGDVHERVEHGEHALGFLDAIGQGLAGGGGVGVGLQRQLRPCRAGGSSGVRRSWATLSSDSRMARMSAWFLSSSVLKRRTSSSNSSSDWRTGTRASSWPVRMIERAVATIWRTGCMARWAKKAPDGKPSRIVTLPTTMKLRRTGFSRAVRLSVVRPICSSELSGSDAPRR